LLLGAATNVNHKVRANALWALGEIRAEAQICVPVLIHALSDTDSGTRLSAAHALGMFGSDAESAIPALTRLSSPATFWGPMGFDQAMIEAQNALRQINRPVVSSSGERVTESELPNLNPLLIPR
ncbi:MAG TPA: HEAT repeat domain-containing protein, partial [Verrucomicrobiae bacterium]|jgi:HEAT repeat protein|nr:HEAT repeat domain-containing protein [Verrucomicrobiae bacterium]